MFYAAAQAGLGCIWTDVAPMYSSTINSLGKLPASDTHSVLSSAPICLTLEMEVSVTIIPTVLALYMTLVSDVLTFYACYVSCIQTGNTVGAIAGIVGPIVVSAFVTAWPGSAGWRAAFILTFGMSAFAFLVWYVYIKAEIVPALNTPAPLPEEEDTK